MLEIYRIFIGCLLETEPLNIQSIILQSTSSNLEPFIGPLTILDSILSNNVNMNNEIPHDNKVVSVVSQLFSSVLSGKEYIGNLYVWRTFNTFIMNKKWILVNIDQLHEHCSNNKLLKVIFYDLIKKDKNQDVYSMMIKNKNQNLLKSDIFKLFANVNYLEIHSLQHPFSLESLLALMTSTNIQLVNILGGKWISSVRQWSLFDDILNKYDKAMFILEFEEHHHQEDLLQIWKGK